MNYAKRVQELEAEGLTTSDAQAVADVEAEKIRRWNAYPEMLQALKDLHKELWAHVKMDVKKHYSLMVADAAASKAIYNATEREP